jgi:nucleotide-binding universal stress UspA family protein
MTTNTRKNKIIVCVDFQEQSLTALRQCYDLARFIKGEIVLLYVIESSDLFSNLFSSNIERAKAEVEIRLKQIIDEERANSDLYFSHAIMVGKVHECIIEKAKEVNARFIIMGKNGSNKGFKKFLGSNTTKVISQSDFPVISIKGKHSIGYKNIVLPLDLTKSTREKVASAISFSRFFGSHIHLVTVHNAGIIYQATSLYNRIKRIERTLNNNGVKSTLKLFKKGKEPDYSYVLQYAKDVNADLIMIMTHQEGNIRDYYIGAFAHHIINDSDIPVLSLTPTLAGHEDETTVESIIDPFNLF